MMIRSCHVASQGPPQAAAKKKLIGTISAKKGLTAAAKTMGACESTA